MILDVSYAQDGPDWEKVMGAPGLEGVWIRASHGPNPDTHFVTNAAGAHTFRRPGQWIGYYHFCEYGTHEVPFAAAHGPGWIVPDRLCLDVEGKIPSNVDAWLAPRFAETDQLSTELGEPTWGYSYEAEAERLEPAFRGRPWWVARVGKNNGPGSPPPSGNYAMWQYSWIGSWPGIVGEVDQSKRGPGYPGAATGPGTGGTGVIVADKVLSSPVVNSSWVLRDTGEVDTIRGNDFYGSWFDVPAEDRAKADVKAFVDLTVRDDGQPGYTIWVETTAGKVNPYDLPIKK